MKKNIIVSAVSVILTIALFVSGFYVYSWGKRAGVQSEKVRQTEIQQVVSRVELKN